MIHLVTGGSGSGKSAFSEQLLCSMAGENRIYIATMKTVDAESRRRVDRHRQMRSDYHFHTIECPMNLSDIHIPSGSLVLLECLSNLVANEMYEPDGACGETTQAVLDGVASLSAQAKDLVIVTNEVFSDTGYDDPQTNEYLKTLGTVNREIAARAVDVTEVIYGIPVTVKS